MLEQKAGVDLMVDKARDIPALFINKFLIEGMGETIKLTFGEASLTPEDLDQGRTLENVFRARVSVAMHVNDLMSLREILNRMYDEVVQPTQSTPKP